jgi:small conductance mechanosensitive channel
MDLAQSHSFLNQLLQSFIRLVPKLMVGVVIFFAFWVASFIVQKLIARISRRFDPNKQIVFDLLNQIAYLGLLIFGLITALGTMGINVSALVAGLGLTGFALGFALKDALSNVLAGAMLLIYRPFRLRDRIAVTGLEGRVINIDLRYTTLQHEERTYLIPNANLFTNPIILIRRDPSSTASEAVS